MSDLECKDILWGWEGYQVKKVERVRHSGRDRLHVELMPESDQGMICNGCGERVDQVHEVTVRWIRDLPILEAETHLQVHRRRVLCPRCGPQLERLGWVDKYARVTVRLSLAVAGLCQVLPVKHVAAFFHLGWDCVKAIDKASLRRSLEPADLSGVRAVVMDEFAIQRGQCYATVVVDPFVKRVLWVGRGRDRKGIRPFFELLGPAGRQQLQAVVMDMNGAYEEEVRQQCPHADIVYDLFHVVAKYGREVIDRVRVDEANRLRHDKQARRVIKGSRWLLLRNRENIATERDRVRLQELLQANESLMTVYVLKDDLKELWNYTYPKAAQRFWDQWYQRAIESGIAPLITFAERLKPYLPGILAHCRWPLHTSLLEGINNKIKVIKRMAYGYRDDDYFFLKIRAAFPGNTG